MASRHCPKCGYTKRDQAIHGDHYLCNGRIPGTQKRKLPQQTNQLFRPQQKRQKAAGEADPPEFRDLGISGQSVHEKSD